MTAPELYEEMRVSANEGSTVRDSLDWACGYSMAAFNELGEFHSWERLPARIKIQFTERAEAWLKRRSK